MELFIVNSNRVGITPQALLIYPFKEIWKAYKLDEALIRLGFIEFMCSHKKSNPYIGYKLDERPDKILDGLYPNSTNEERKDITGDSLIIAGIDIYTKIQHDASPSIRFYEASRDAAEKMVDFFATFDLNATNPRTGTLLYKPADITRTLKDVNDVLKTMGALKEKVIMEIAEDAKGKGNRDINYFEKSKKDR